MSRGPLRALRALARKRLPFERKRSSAHGLVPGRRHFEPVAILRARQRLRFNLTESNLRDKKKGNDSFL